MKSERRKSSVLRRFLAIGLAAPLFLGLLVWASPAGAIQQSETFPGNDCPGFFGSPFASCVAIESPVIIKFNVDELAEINSSLFPTIDGSEFDFDFAFNDEGEIISGSWTYTPGPGDPSNPVKYWAAKGGDFFEFFWNGSLGPTTAEPQLLGTFSTPLRCGSEADPQPCGLSHLTFYDSGDEPLPRVPGPSTLVLLGTALSLLAVARRRRSG